ncbi:MAG TPA: Ig-like domain-containing protein, partial [Candidatus Eisenbacteria bacterium]|nr:Ig-like domain-containing protein [Candidatus Eisenbacteria bacterium]
EGEGKLEAYDTIEGPYVAGLSPGSGGPGTLITLYGANFNPVPASNFVSMGSVVLTPVSVSPGGTSMVVKQTALVTEGHVAVTTGGKTSNIVEYRVVNQIDPGNFALTPGFAANVATTQNVTRAPNGTFLIVRGSDGTLSMLGESPEIMKFHRPMGSLTPGASGLTGPGPLVITPDGSTLFAGNRSASRVLAYSLARDASTPITYLGVVQNATSPAILDPASMAITPDGSRVYVASAGDHRIVEFSAQTRTVLASITDPSTTPAAIVMHPQGQRVYVLVHDGAPGIRVGVFDVDPGSASYRTRIATVSLSGSPSSMHGIFASPSGDRVYALVKSGSIYRLHHINSDAASGSYHQEIGTLQVGSGAGVPVVELNQSGTLAFVVDPVATTLRAIDLSTFTFTTDLLTDSGLGLAQDLDISRDDARLYVASGNSLLQTDLTATSNLIFVSGKDQVGVENQTLAIPITVRGPAGSEGTAVTFQALGGGTFGDGDAYGYAALNGTNSAKTQFNPGSGMGLRTIQVKLSGFTIQTTVTVVGDTALVPVQRVSTTPAASSTVGVLTSVAASFSKGVDPSTVNTTSFPVKQSGVTVEGTYHFADHERRITFVPRAPLDFSTTYTVDLTSALEDYNGNPLDNPASFSFQTEGAPTSVSLSALSPNAGIVGAPVVISGEGFEASPSGNTVLFGTTEAIVERADPRTLVTHVPDGAETGSLTVTARSQTSSGITFEVIVPAPDPILDPGEDVDVPTSGNQVVVTPDEVRAYMTSPEGNTVVPILIETLVSEDPIAVGIYPVGIALSPDGRRAFVTNYYSDDVYVIDTNVGSPDFHSVVETISLSNHPIAAAVNPNGRELYVATAGTRGEVIVFEADTETDTYSAKKSIETGSSNQTVTVTADGGQLVIGTSFGIVLVDIEGDDYGAKKSIDTGSSSQSVTVTADGGFILVLTATGTLLLINIDPDLTEEQIEDAKKSIETGSTSRAVTVSPDGGEVYVSTADGRILVFTLTLAGGEAALAEPSDSGLSLVLTETLTVGENLAGLSFVNRDKLIVVDAGASTVRVLSGGNQWISCNGVTTNNAGTLLQADMTGTLTVVLPTGAIQIRNTLTWSPGGTNLDLALYQR